MKGLRRWLIAVLTGKVALGALLSAATSRVPCRVLAGPRPRRS